MPHIILDTDPGIDDALALFLALASPEITPEAVTTVQDNACSMRLDRYRAFHQISFLFHLCFLLLLSSIRSSTKADVGDPRSLLAEGKNFFPLNGTSFFS